ncbi:5-methylthioadenosine/S-adenosylhomocysteine deaminase [Microbacterium murale]|uniref:5-methylthioadenosine/S-adenosylhomocysteine deaminase n=2 Tax=Microbacterium murale TaxID=1081040 RepID=A0ABU0PE94_9MICO|nr:5-methylthioadenosine/S-adenosylhomocysteine deaminase [Microbacterium murale]
MTEMNPCDVLIRASWLVTSGQDRRIITDAAVAIRGDRIAAVGTRDELSSWQSAKVIDLPGTALMPGFVDGHNHLFQALARGLGEGQSIWPWLCNFMWPYAIAMTPADARAAARLGALEAVRSGITTVIDNHYAPTDLDTTLAVAAAIEDVGLRGAVARGVLGRRSKIGVRRGQPEQLYRYDTQDEIAITRDAAAVHPAGSRVEVWPGPVNLSYLDQDLMAASIELARELGTRWHTHCSEGPKDPESYLEEYGIRPVLWLAREGLLDERATLAHAIWLDDAELDAIAASGASVAHNPTSNAYLASGSIRLGKMLERGIPVSLGTDGPSCGHRQDPFECMKQAIFIQRLATLDPTTLRAHESLALGTREGGNYTGFDVGELAVGLLADIVAVDLSGAHQQPVHDPISTLVYSTRGSDVVLTMVGGRVVFSDGVVHTLDEAGVIAEANEAAHHLIERRPSLAAVPGSVLTP